MKKKHLLLLFFLIGRISLVMGIPGTPIPNPKDIIPSGAINTLIYGTGTNPSLSKSDSATINLLSGGEGFFISGNEYEGAWIPGSIDLNTKKYLYFVYSGPETLNKIQNNWSEIPISYEIPLENDWFLGVVNLGSLTSLTDLYFQKRVSNLYIANIWISDYEYIPPIPSGPENPPARPTLNSNRVKSFYGKYFSPSSPPANRGGSVTEINYGEENQYTCIKADGTDAGYSAAGFSQYGTDVTTMTNLRFDVWIGTGDPDLKVKLFAEGNSSVEITEKGAVAEEWKTIDIPLSRFTDFNVNSINTIQIVTPQSPVVFIDNVLLYDGSSYPAPTETAEDPINRTTGYLSLYNDNPYTTSTPIWNLWCAEKTENSINGNNFQKVFFDGFCDPDNNGAGIDIKIPTEKYDLSQYKYIYFDLWLPESLPAGRLQVQLNAAGLGSENDSQWSLFANRPIRIDSDNDNDNTPLPAKQWIPIKMSLENFKGANWGLKPSLEDIITNTEWLRIAVGGNTEYTRFYIDNVYFYTPEDPESAPQPPLFIPNDVKSVYGYYNDNASITWAGTTEHDAITDGDKSQKVVLSATWQGASIDPMDLNLSVGKANILFMNVYVSQAETDLRIRLNGNDAYNYPVTHSSSFDPGEWHSIQIPLPYIGEGISSINKIEFSGTGTIYIDDIFFVKPFEPIIAPSAPPARPESSYHSIYSDQTKYETTITWDQDKASQEAFTIGSDEIRKITLNANNENSNVQMQLTSKLDIQKKGYTYLHFDIWSADIINEGDVSVGLYKITAPQGYSNIYQNIVINSNEANGWKSFDLKLSDFTLDWGDIETILSNLENVWFIKKGVQNKTNTFYVDNIYFYIPTEPDASTENPIISREDRKSIYDESGYVSDLVWNPLDNFETILTFPENPYIQIKDLSIPNTYIKGNPINLIFDNGKKANMFHLDIWVAQPNTDFTLVLTDDTNNTYSHKIPTNNLLPGRWNTITIPLEYFDNENPFIRATHAMNAKGITTVTQINASGSGIVYLDNVFFYYTEYNATPVAKVYINGMASGETEENKTNGYMTIGDAMNYIYSLNTTNQDDIKIAIIRNSNEPSAIDIPNKEWANLTVYPSDEINDEPKKVVLTAVAGRKALFSIENEAKNIIFDGKMNYAAEVIPRQLIFQGKYFPSDPANNDYNTVIGGIDMENLKIEDCMFIGYKGENLKLRPETVISASGTNIKIRRNYFEDCIFVGKTANNSNNSMILIFNGINKDNIGCEIDGNHFYETTENEANALEFYYPIFRMAVTYLSSTKDISQFTNPLKIINNKFGGNARINGEISGTMYIGKFYGTDPIHTYDPDTDPNNDANKPTTSSLFPLNVKLGDPAGSNYALIANNEIAHIAITSPTTGLFREADNPFEKEYMGEFTGITTQNGKILIRENSIHDVSNVARPLDDGNTYFGYITLGMRNEVNVGGSSLIIENNEIYDFQADLTGDNQKITGMLSGIVAHGMNYWHAHAKGVVRNNRIVLRNNTQKKLFSDISAIAASIRNLNGTGGNIDGKIQLDIYNNICVMDEFKYSAGTFYTTSLISLFNDAGSDNGIINNYNNILYIQPKTSGSFDNIKSRVSGLFFSANSGITNIFHNTVLLKDFSSANILQPPTVFLSNLRENEGSNNNITLNIRNNNFVNLNPYGYMYYNMSLTSVSPQIHLDYNNYYLPATGLFFGEGANSNYREIKTFDNWKFSNILSYLNRTTEHDHHSRFLDPDFKNVENISDLSISGIEILRNNLVPKRFLGGCKTPDDFLSDLLLLPVSTENGNVTVNETVTTSDDTNYDFGLEQDENGNIVGTIRRPYLPTMGALNTGFTNYWTGAVSANWEDQGNWANGVKPGYGENAPYEDVVFAPDGIIQNHLKLNKNTTIHDIYNDTEFNVDLNTTALTVTGYIGQERPESKPDNAKIDASSKWSTLTFNGLDGYALDGYTAPDMKYGAAAQHIFKNTFVDNKVNNLRLNNKSEYFVLLHGKKPWTSDTEPSVATLEIMNDFLIDVQDNTNIQYPDEEAGNIRHCGALNCTWYNTQLKFSGDMSVNYPALSSTSAWNRYAPFEYRPYTGQRIPRFGIYNDEVYDLVSNSTRLVTYHDYLYVRNNLTIYSGKVFEIAADKFVKVDGITSNPAGNETGLIIKSRELNPEQAGVGFFAETTDYLNDYLFPVLPRPNATFIYSNNINEQVPATVEMYSPAHKDPNPKPDGYIYRWQYFVPAVKSSGSSIFDVNQLEFDLGYKSPLLLNDPSGTTLNPTHGSPYWRYVTDYSNLSAENNIDGENPAGYGYSITQKKPKVYQLKGNLTNQAETRIMTYYKYDKEVANAYSKNKYDVLWNEQYPNDGRYVFGNPYTAALDIRKLNFGTELEKVVYIYNTGHTDDWIEQNASQTDYLGNIPGSNMAIPQKWAGLPITIDNTDILFPAFISSMQGFTVSFNPTGELNASTTNSYTTTSTTNATTSTFSIDYNHSSGNETIGKNESELRSSTEEMSSYMLITLTSGDYFDKVFIAIHPDSKKGFDNGWDGRKYIVRNSPVLIFTEERDNTSTPSSYYQISTMDDINDTRLGILTKDATGEFELKILHEGFPDNTKIYLEDISEEKKIDITQSGEIYSFTYGTNNQIKRRFRITTELNDYNNMEKLDSSEQSLKIFSFGKSIKVVLDTNQTGSVFVYNLAGNCVLSHAFKDTHEARIDSNLESGVYIVKVLTNNTVINKTIILN